MSHIARIFPASGGTGRAHTQFVHRCDDMFDDALLYSTDTGVPVRVGRVCSAIADRIQFQTKVKTAVSTVH